MDAVDLFLGQTGESLVRRLEDHLSPGMSAMEFPSQFTSNPKALAELIQSISSKKIPTFQGQSQLQSQSTQERSKAIQKYFKEMLNLMISAGAFVSCVKPEFLMSHEDYRRIVNSQMDVLKSDNKGIVHDEMVEYNKKLDSIFPIIQKEAWLTVLLQIVKVYVTSMVTVKHFRALPGLERDEMDMEWPINSKSNVFSTAEYVLLRWSSYHMWKRAGIKKRLTNFTDDFKNSVPIASLILSHIPHLESTNFAYFHPLCETSEQLEENCRIINGALSVIFNTNSILLPVDQVVRGEAALDIQLLLLFLYQTLPHFLPKALVEFHGGLHDKVIRSIEISNPSGRALSYTAHLGGSPDFTLVEGSTLSVAPKSQSKMPLLFASRFATRVEGQVKLQTRKMGLNSASILVFDLVGSVEPPTPRRMFKIDAPMYCTPPNTVDLEITSPFAVTGRFKVSLRQHHRVAPLLLLHKGRSPTEISCPEDASFFDTFSPPAFKALENELVIEPNQSRFLPIAFQPFDSGIHECTLHFVDEAVGEFIYQIDGRATAPQAIDFVWTCKAASSLEKPIRITPVNPIREKALYSVLQKRQLKGIGKKKSLTSGQLETDRDSFQTPRRPLKYKVEYLSPYFSGPAEITIRPASDVVKEKKTLFELDQNYTELPILFKPKLPGKYSCKIVLMGTEVSDVRVFFIQGVAISEGSKAELDFNTPVRQTLTQDIPIVNKTDEDWTIKASLQGNFFSGPHALVAPAHAVTNYTITFKPMRPTEVEGMLTMSNLHTAQKHVYYLRGVGQEPLPEEHREIKCSVRDKVRETFKVTNYTDQDAEYDVVTDIPNTTCLHRLFVPSGQSVDHTLEIHAKKSGQFTQLVTYVNRSDGSYVWYTCRMVVRPPPCEETIRMTTTVRKAVAIEIPIHNPLDEAVTFDVMYTGEGLVGSHKFKVEGKSEALYAMSYAPISSAVESGKLTFQNEFVGEFWYDLQLEAKEAPPIMLPDMSAPLGKCSAQIVTIQNIFPNPTRLEIFLNEGSTDFQVNYPPMTHLKDIARKPRSTQTVIVSLKPMERADVQLVFWPSSLTEPRTSILHVLSTTLGNSTYHVQGMGVLPEPMDEIIIRGQLNHSVSGILSFTNPLLDPIPVSITIKNDDVTAMSGTPDITLMIHKKPRYNVGGLERLDIPFVYTPKKMDRAIVSVIVEMGKLKWVYPVTGMPDAPITTSTQVLECRSRESFETDLQVMLHGFLIEHEDIATSTNTADWTSRIGYSLFTGNVERHDLRKAVAVTLKDSKFIDKEGLALLFKVTFSPVRPSDQSTTLTVTQHATGSRWKFPLRLISHPPLIDDTIVIEGAINKVMGVSFVLKNSAHHRRPFRAFFTRDSPGEFGVHPTHGTLLPDSEMVDGANAFVVTYKATTYGKNVYGTLMIEADDISWSYEIRGVTPKTHNPPTSVEPRYSIISNASSSALKLPAMINGPIRPVPTLPVKEFRAGSEAESNVGGRKNFLRENALMAGRKMR
ncbi:hypothetical protein BC829DRAFT_267855 [Chytridium lagenaria]|nr:hypothetical protein BC829DRAFT_267855 [Chytridium lagenaria]